MMPPVEGEYKCSLMVLENGIDTCGEFTSVQNMGSGLVHVPDEEKAFQKA